MIEHKPINRLSQKGDYILTKEIAQLFVKSYEIAKENGVPIYASGVYVEMKNKEVLFIVKDLPTLSDAKFIEQEIAQYLNINDRLVAGDGEEMHKAV